MSYPAEGPLPIIDLLPAATILIEAVDPATGATVAGVSFSNGLLYGQGEVGEAETNESTLRVWLQPPGGGD